MKILSTEVLYKGRFSSYNVTKFEDNLGKVRGWEWFQKRNVVAILPVTSEGKFVCIESFRVPIQSYVIESPAGLMEHNVADVEQIKKELLEETGYACKKISVIGTFPMNAGISSNSITYCIGFSAHKVSVQQLEESEEIMVREFTREELISIALSKDKKVDPGLFSLIFLFDSINNEK